MKLGLCWRWQKRLSIFSVSVCIIAGALIFITLALIIPGNFQVAHGVTYRQIVRTNPSPCRIHLLTVDPRKAACFLAAMPERGGITLDMLAKKEHAVAAINGGFFATKGAFAGLGIGLCKREQQWIAGQRGTFPVLGWNPRECGKIGLMHVDPMLRINTQLLPVARVNQPRNAADTTIYTPFFGTSTKTSGGTEIIIASDRVIAIAQEGNSPIPHDGFVYSIGSAYSREFPPIAIGDPVDLIMQWSEDDATWNTKRFILSGSHLLVVDNKVCVQGSKSSTSDFVHGLHPRTAVGIRADGTWIFTVVDGRLPEESVGMSLSELAEFLIGIGCVHAINLDGGSSSTMVVRNKIVNCPCGAVQEGIAPRTAAPILNALVIKEGVLGRAC